MERADGELFRLPRPDINPYLGVLWDLGEALTEIRNLEGARAAYTALHAFMPWHDAVPTRLAALETLEAGIAPRAAAKEDVICIATGENLAYADFSPGLPPTESHPLCSKFLAARIQATINSSY